MKSRSSSRPPAPPQSARATVRSRGQSGRWRRSPSRPGSCDTPPQSLAWQSSRIWGPWRNAQAPLISRSGGGQSHNTKRLTNDRKKQY